MAELKLSEDLAVVKSEMIRIRRDLDKLVELILEGNGHSMLSRLSMVEMKIDENKANKAHVQIAVFSAVLSFITSAGILILQWVSHR